LYMTDRVDRLAKNRLLQAVVEQRILTNKSPTGSCPGGPCLPLAAAVREGRFVPASVDVTLAGRRISNGLGIGQALHYGGEWVLDIPTDRIEREEVNQAIKQINEVLNRVRQVIRQELKEPLLAKEQEALLAVHLQLLNDPAIVETTREFVQRDFLNVAAAFDLALNEQKEMLLNLVSIDDSGMITRMMLEVKHVHLRIMRELGLTAGENLADVLASSEHKEIVIVAEALSPSDTVVIKRANGKVKGFVVQEGSANGHVAILARAMGLPAVAGIVDPLAKISAGCMVVVDGREGKVIANASEAVLAEMRGEEARYQAVLQKIRKEVRGKACQTKDGVAVTLLGNIGFSWEKETIAANDGEGVGLYRTEMLFEEEPDILPSENKQVALYESLGPAVIRVFDFGRDKQVPLSIKNLLGEGELKDPLFLTLALRGVFSTQVRSILRASAFNKDLALMFPMISTKDQLSAALAVVDSVKKELTQEGVDCNQEIKVGVMVETAEAVDNIEEFAKLQISFFSIGTNDLTSSILGVSRTDPAFDPFNIDVLRAIAKTVGIARSQGIEVCVCGNLAAEPEGVKFLIGLGITRLSVPPREIPLIKHVVMAIEQEKAAQYAQVLLAGEIPQQANIPAEFLTT